MRYKYLISSLLIVSIFISCENDIYNNLDIRVKEIIDYRDGIEEEKAVFEYSGDKLIRIMMYVKTKNNEWKENLKVEISYEGSKAIKITFSKDNDTWEIIEKNEYTIENDLLIEENEFKNEQDTWKPHQSYTYEYSGENIVSWKNTCFIGQDSLIFNKGEYIYFNDKLITYYQYEYDSHNRDTMLLESKQEYIYSGILMDTLIDYYLDYENNWIKNYIWEYSYFNDRISELSQYSYDEEHGDWKISPYYILKYHYNNIGYLREKYFRCPEYSNQEFCTVYKYEPGNGNAKYFWYNQYDMLYCQPTLNKSTDLNKDLFIPFYKRIMIL
jgi:hypothetical protein